MKQYKKIQLIIIAMLILLLGFSSKSEAYTELFNPWINLREDGRWYCTDHSQGLHNRMIHYEQVGTYTIIGNTCSGISADINAKLAYILYQDVYKQPGPNASAYLSKYPEQVALWLKLRSWYDTVGYRLNSGLSGLIGAPSYGDADSYGVRGSVDRLLADADNYANKIKGTMKNNTNQANIKAQNYKKDGQEYVRVGPFNINFKGTFASFELIGNDNINIPIEGYEQYNGSSLQMVENPSSGKDFYVSFKVPENVYKIAKIKIGSKQREIRVTFSFWRNPTGSNDQNMLHKDGSGYTDVPYSAEWEMEINLLGNITIKKTDKTTGRPLNAVGFTLRMTSGEKAGQYVTIGKNNIAKYTKKPSDIYTDSKGSIQILQLWPGNYELIETVNPHYGYEETPKNFGRIIIKAGETNKAKIENLRKYIKITGYAWEDIGYENGKEKEKNSLYRQGALDDKDQLLQGIPVELKDMNGNIIASTTTNEKGQYVFEKVLIDELAKYYIEFQYNGMSYQNVTVYADKYLLVDNVKETDTKIAKAKQQGSNRVGEGENRTQFNEQYQTITYGKSNAHELTYNTTSGESKISYRRDKDITKYNYGYLGNEANRDPITGIDEQYVIRANTKNTYNGGLNRIKTASEIRKNAIVEISDINLGIEAREKMDLSMIKDIDTVQVHINGANHIYRYADRFNPDLYSTYDDEGKSGYDMAPQVKFGKKYGSMSYTRALYESDILYDGEDELQVKVTYKIGIKNGSANLKAVVNEMNDYYDNKYVDSHDIVAGKEINSDGSIKGENLEIEKQTSQVGEQEGYQKIQIKTNLEIEKQEEQYIYIQLQVRPEKIVEILGESKEEVKLDNIAEISSYSIKDKEGKVYAAIDQDSQPGSINITKLETYEDDTDKAPGLKLVLQEERKLSGKVFEDKTGKVQLTTGEIREGDGKYIGEEDIPIAGVEVKMVNANTGEIAQIYDRDEPDPNKKWKEAITTTDQNGEYKMGGFIPSPENYKILFTWGDKHYKVQDYKSTIVDETSYNNKGEGKQLEWYKNAYKTNYADIEWDFQKKQEIRVSDAVDNYTTRQEIDQQASLVMNKNQHVVENYEGNLQGKQKEEAIITQMTSATPTFRVNLEYSTTPTTNPREEYELTEDGKVKIDEKGYVVKKEDYSNNLKSIDFGIVERARQVLSLDKKLKNAKVILPNGMVLIEAEVENGQLKNKVRHGIYLPDSEGAGAQIKFELDDEIIQGAKMELTYQLEVENVSELEYLNETYYLYGSKKVEGLREEDLVTLKATNIIDYLNNNVATELEGTGIGNIIQEEQQKLNYIKNGLLEDTQELRNLLKETNRILDITAASEEALKPRGIKGNGKTKTDITLKTYKLLSNRADEEEIEIDNFAEIIRVEKSGGASLITMLGNYTASTSEREEEYDESKAERLIIVPPTGLTTNYIAYTILIISSLGILVIGILLIRKIVLKS